MPFQTCRGGGDFLWERHAGGAGSAFAEAEEELGAERFGGALEKGQKAVQAFRAASDPNGVHDAVRLVVKALVGLQQHAQAQELAKAELAKCREAGQRLGEAKMLMSLGEASLAKEGKAKAEAVSSLKEARSICRNQNNKEWEVKALLTLAWVNMARTEDLGAVETALKNASEGWGEMKGAVGTREISYLLGRFQIMKTDKRMEALVLLKMSEWNLKLGDQARALSDAEDALEIYQMLQSPKEVKALRAVFDAHLARGDLRKARLVAAEALRHFRELGDKPAQVEAVRMLVELYVKANRVEEALTAAKRGITVCKELGDVASQASLMLTVARARLRMAQMDKAIAIARDAFAMLKKIPSTTQRISEDKVEAMHVLIEANYHMGHKDEAMDLALEFKEKFEEEPRDPRALGHALLITATLEFKRGDVEEAASHNSKAQALFSEESDISGEADALKMQAEIHWKKNEFKSAIRFAEKGRVQYRELGKHEGEIACMYMVSENAVRLAVKEGARIFSEEPMPRQARDALEKGIKLAESGIKLAKKEGLATAPELMGSLLCARAQGLTLKARFEEALACADEAVLIYRDLMCYQLEANALMLACDNLRALQKVKEAAEAADEALALYRHVGDTAGENLALEVIATFQEFMQQQAPQFVPPPPGAAPAAPGQVPVWQQQQQDGGPPEAVAKGPAAPRGPAGPALDVKSGLSLEVVTSKVREIALRITGADEEEVEVDTPLMEAGLTSNSAIIMRDELSQALPGVQLPVTLVFDYPSVSAMTELIMQSTGGGAIGFHVGGWLVPGLSWTTFIDTSTSGLSFPFHLGAVTAIVKEDADPSLHRGFAFVQFAESGEAEKAVAELNGAKICGRTVAVDWAVDASVYNSLQREEVPKPRKEKRLPKKPVEDEKEEDDEEADPDKELKRMKELLGDDIEEDDEDEDQDEKNEDDEEEEEETTKKVKGKKKKTDAKEVTMRDLLNSLDLLKSLDFLNSLDLLNSLWLSESPSEMVYPIHVAAQQGDCNLLRTMLALGASLDQQTSRGRTAYDFAFEANRDGSHLDTLGLLRTRVQVFNTMKDFLRAKISKSKVRRVESAAVSL
ncbi:unnamed protein product [Effrenium voratum]|nr:unnamed protein product [Effrenium voratum]